MVSVAVTLRAKIIATIWENKELTNLCESELPLHWYIPIPMQIQRSLGKNYGEKLLKKLC